MAKDDDSTTDATPPAKADKASKADVGDGEEGAPVRGQLPVVEPIPAANNPMTIGQQMEAGATRGTGVGQTVGGQNPDGSNFDIRPAIVSVNGRLRQRKQLNTH